MTAYLDTSVVLRKFLQDRDALADWGDWEQAFSSVLLRVEVRRALDRLRLEGRLDDAQRALLGRQLEAVCETVHLVGIQNEILERAAQPFPTVVATLDALHLATALMIGATLSTPICFLTHDAQLARAAEALGLETRGT